MRVKKILFILFCINIIHLPAQNLELPKAAGSVYCYTGFTLQYNEEYEQADWVAYELTKKEVYGRVRRSNNFRPDPFIITGSAELSDYKRSGYDRGHLAPSGDMKWSPAAMSDSFYMSNITPQVSYFNREIWKDLEELVRKWAVQNKKLLITAGPVVIGRYKTIGENSVAVPEYFYKVIIDYTKPDLKGIGFIIPNKKCRKPLKSYAVSIDNVENITGIDFFYLIPDKDEKILEADFDLNRWSWE